ncbi:MAG: serine hydrolase, partial [Pseudomonadota bacterium]
MKGSIDVTALEAAEPEACGMNSEAVAEAVSYAVAHESQMDRDIARALDGGHFSEPMPDGEIIGPVHPRGDPSGMILRHGKVVSQWGPVDAPDMTFSVTKSYLAICAGLAWDDGLIQLDAPVRDVVPDLFEAAQNQTITLRHLLHQTSEWEGELWGKADRIDRNRTLGAAPGTDSIKGTHRDLQAPGTFWEYNDIRVNVLSYALMQVFRRPLPDILRDRIMDPIGASQNWAWHGYRNSTVEINGVPMQSVSGGAHWGGGLMIPTTDHARVGLLMTQRGRRGDTLLLSEAWIDQCLKPCPLNSGYGFLWWLNGEGETAPSAPPSSYFAIG